MTSVTPAQIFVLFYAVSFGAMLNASLGMRAFPWGYCTEKDQWVRSRLGHRLFSSLLFLNVLPFVTFAAAMPLVPEGHGYCWWCSLWVGVASLSAFGPYRLYHLFLGLFPGFFYLQDEWAEFVRVRHYRVRPWGNFWGAGFYFCTIVVMWFATRLGLPAWSGLSGH